MAIPFKLSFIEHPSKPYRTENEVSPFVQSKEAMYRIDRTEVVQVTENRDVSVRFEGNADYRLYMDGLDTLKEEAVSEDADGEVYLKPSQRETTLFSYQERDGYYPFIPGYYRIRVVGGEKTYYSFLRVNPKQVTKEQWESMRDELESTVVGLAQDLVRRNSNIESFGDSPIPATYMRQWFILDKHKGSLINAMEEILRSPRTKVEKTYEVVPAARAKRLDEGSIKYLAQHPDKKGLIKEPIPFISHELPENIWVLQMVKNISDKMKVFGEFLSSYRKSVIEEIDRAKQWHSDDGSTIRNKRNVLEQIEMMKGASRRFLFASSRFLTENWVEKLPTTRKPHPMPLALSLDSRYRKVYQVYRELNNEEFSISLDPSYTYHWKRTDLLYEIWGYLQVILSLSSNEVGFKPLNGWIYDEHINGNKFTVPSLLSGTTVELKKDDVTIKVVYEGELLTNRRDTSLAHPLYTSGVHTRPDCRLDIFDKAGFIGSVLIDFKYRPAKYIWDERLIRTRQQTQTMKQLDSYSNQTRSSIFLKGKVPEGLPIRPVSEVWAVYPDKHGHQINREVDGFNIRMMDLTPSSNNKHFREALKTVVDKVVSVSEQFDQFMTVR